MFLLQYCMLLYDTFTYEESILLTHLGSGDTFKYPYCSTPQGLHKPRASRPNK